MPQCPYCQSKNIKPVEPRRLEYTLLECQNPPCKLRFSLPGDENQTERPARPARAAKR